MDNIFRHQLEILAVLSDGMDFLFPYTLQNIFFIMNDV